jgi:hypothetical protein
VPAANASSQRACITSPSDHVLQGQHTGLSRITLLDVKPGMAHAEAITQFVAARPSRASSVTRPGRTKCAVRAVSVVGKPQMCRSWPSVKLGKAAG